MNSKSCMKPGKVETELTFDICNSNSFAGSQKDIENGCRNRSPNHQKLTLDDPGLDLSYLNAFSNSNSLTDFLANGYSCLERSSGDHETSIWRARHPMEQEDPGCQELRIYHFSYIHLWKKKKQEYTYIYIYIYVAVSLWCIVPLGANRIPMV